MSTRRKDHGLGRTAAGGSGGSFATHMHTQATSAALDEARWGSVDNVSSGSRSPWGEVQTATHVAPGIVFVDTAGHGGIKLSKERNAAIPAALRRPSGWYEEDCEAHIPNYYFAEDTQRAYSSEYDADSRREQSLAGIKNWFPEQWESATGETVDPAESSVKREMLFNAEHHEHMVTYSASAAESDESLVLVTARRASTGEMADFLVPRSEYRSSAQGMAFVIDEARHPRLPDKDVPVEKIPVPVKVQELIKDRYDGLTEHAKKQVTKDLLQRWRSADGTVRSFAEILENEGAVDRSVYIEGTKRIYAIAGKDSSSYRCSKATWDFLSTIPDRRARSTIAWQDVQVLEAKLDKIERWEPEYLDVKEKMNAARAHAQRVSDEERLAEQELHGTWDERDARRRAKQAERERLATL